MSGIWVEVIVGAFFLFLAAIFFAAEFAFFSTSEDQLREADQKKTRLALKMLSKPLELMIGLLVASSLSAAVVILMALRIANEAVKNGEGQIVPMIIALIIGGLLVAVVARLMPRIYVSRNPEGVAMRLAYPTFFFSLLILPIIKGVMLIVKGSFAAGALAREMLLRSGQLKAIARVEGSSSPDVVEDEEMIEAIFEMRDTTVREVMVPRIDMVCAEISTTVADAIKIISEKGHSRIPVYEKTIDEVKGILHARDLFGLIGRGELRRPIGDLMREAFFVPESKKVRHLLSDLRKLKSHMAIVVDEFGGVVGLVTLEDVLEEIVGEIYDEHETRHPLLQILNDDEVRVLGKMRIDDLDEAIGITIAETDQYDTIGGYVYDLFGRVPSQGEMTEAGGLTFVVEKTSRQRIESLIIRGKEIGKIAAERFQKSNI